MKNKNYCKNESNNDHKLSLNFFRIFSQRILGAGPKGLRVEIWISRMKNAWVNYKKLKMKKSRNF